MHVVTGAFGYSGRHIAAQLLESGHRVRTLTNSPHRPHPFGDRVDAHPLDFANPERLADSLRGASVLYNTYWVRFNHRDFGFDEAIANTRILFGAARAAGVGRVVHVSITNPSESSSLPYFRGKALLERALKASGLSHAILRPAVLFGGAGILINNIAWALRRLPVFGVFGNGQYQLQPIHVDDFAALAVSQGAEETNEVIDAIGPETFTYRALVEELADAIGVRRPIVSVSPRVAARASRWLGRLLDDVVLTRDEIAGLMQGLLATDSRPRGTVKLSAWAREHGETLGRHYASELARRRDREAPLA